MSTDLYSSLATKKRHDKLRALKRCIGAPIVGDVSRRGRAHGPVHRGGRCRECWERKLASDVTAYWQAKARGAM